MSRYRAVFDTHGLLAEYENGDLVFLRADYESPNRSDLPTPMVMRDIEPYQNMIDGKMISSRSAHRDLLKAHNCIEIGNETMTAPKLKPISSENRRASLHRQLGDMSDKQANKILKQLRK